MAFIVPSRLWDGAESLGIETASCLCFLVSDSIQWGIVASTFVYFTQLSPSGGFFLAEMAGQQLRLKGRETKLA